MARNDAPQDHCRPPLGPPGPTLQDWQRQALIELVLREPTPPSPEQMARMSAQQLARAAGFRPLAAQE
jgi:hypothetical protein